MGKLKDTDQSMNHRKCESLLEGDINFVHGEFPKDASPADTIDDRSISCLQFFRLETARIKLGLLKYFESPNFAYEKVLPCVAVKINGLKSNFQTFVETMLWLIGQTRRTQAISISNIPSDFDFQKKSISSDLIKYFNGLDLGEISFKNVSPNSLTQGFGVVVNSLANYLCDEVMNEHCKKIRVSDRRQHDTFSSILRGGDEDTCHYYRSELSLFHQSFVSYLRDEVEDNEIELKCVDGVDSMTSIESILLNAASNLGMGYEGGIFTVHKLMRI